MGEEGSGACGCASCATDRMAGSDSGGCTGADPLKERSQFLHGYLPTGPTGGGGGGTRTTTASQFYYPALSGPCFPESDGSISIGRVRDVAGTRVVSAKAVGATALGGAGTLGRVSRSRPTISMEDVAALLSRQLPDSILKRKDILKQERASRWPAQAYAPRQEDEETQTPIRATTTLAIGDCNRLQALGRSAVGDVFDCVFWVIGHAFDKYEEGEFCEFHTASVSEERQEFVELAWWQLVNVWDEVLQDWWDGRGDSSTSYMNHLDGTIKPKFRIDDLSGSGAIGLSCPDGLGTGVIWLDEDYLQCCMDRFNNTSRTSSGWGNLGEAYCALMEVAAVIAHEAMHFLFNGERKAFSIEGFLRFHWQDDLGLNSETNCGQTSWPCGTSTSSSSCDTADELFDDITFVCG